MTSAVYAVTPGKYEFVSESIGNITKPIHVSTPIISPNDTLFLESQKAIISIESATTHAAIYYTLDGSTPDRETTKYEGPFELQSNTIVRAAAYRDGYIPSFLESTSVNFVNPSIHGIEYTVYEGAWDARPELELTEPVSNGRVSGFHVADIEKREDYVAIVFTSNLEIDADGDYVFYCSANDGSVLYLDNEVVVDNAGYFGTKVDSARLYLRKGRHPIRALYYENSGSESMDVSIEGPNLRKQPIPPYNLFLPN